MTSLQTFELLSFKSRPNESRIVVYVGIHNTAEQSVNNAQLVKQIIIVRLHSVMLWIKLSSNIYVF